MNQHNSSEAPALRVAVVGLGYFSQFHLNAWSSSTAVKLVGVCDADKIKVDTVSARYAVPGFTDAAELFDAIDADIVDIIAPPQAHTSLLRAALKPKRLLICQKPFCTSLAIAEEMAAEVTQAGAELIIHENFRFQPWYRTLKELLTSGELGSLYQCRFALRPGDGRGENAYLDRQPAFQSMQQFLVRETGIHYIDLFRWLFGEISEVYADLRQLNPAISGEDAGNLIFNHSNGVVTLFDGNRLADHAADDRRLTMGEMTLETEQGTVRLDGQGKLWRRQFQNNDEHELKLTHAVDHDSFGGGCVNALIQHVINAKRGDGNMENDIHSYLPVMKIAEACYESDQAGKKITL